jgi:hypothetical protein
MMKTRSKLAWLCTAAATAVLAISCATPPRIPLRDNVAVKKAAYGSPSDSVLIYGSVSMKANIFNFLSTKSVDNLEMIQLNPAQKSMVITPARRGDNFFTEPIHVGSSVKLFYYSYKEGRTIYLNSLGIQGLGAMDRKLDKPGLLFLGSMLYCDKKFADTKMGLATSDSMMNFEDFFPVGDVKEVDILKELSPAFRGTEWEPLIAARIEELKK